VQSLIYPCGVDVNALNGADFLFEAIANASGSDPTKTSVIADAL